MQTNTAKKPEFTPAQIESCTILLKEQFSTLKGYKDATGQPAKSWLDAAQFELNNIKKGKVTDTEETETFSDMPLSLANSLKNYASTIKAFQDGTVNRETVNSTLQKGLLNLQDSGNKDFSLITSILWLMYTTKGWRHDFDVSKKYIEATTPFIIRVTKKDVGNGKTENEALTGGGMTGHKELVIRLIRKKGSMYRNRPPHYWDSLRSFKQNGRNNSKFHDPAADAKKASTSIEKAVQKSSEADLSGTKRIELAADLLSAEQDTEAMATMLHNFQHKREEYAALVQDLKAMEAFNNKATIPDNEGMEALQAKALKAFSDLFASK